MRKKILSLIFIAIFIFGCPNFSSAERISSETDITRVFNNDPEKRRNLTVEEKVKELLIMGATYEEAKYYAVLDNKIAELERTNQKIDLTHVMPVSLQTIASNPKMFKQQVLALEPSALKAALQSPSLKNGFSDVSKLVQNNPGRTKYVVQYPDGSSAAMVLNRGTKTIEKEVTPAAYAEDEYWRISNCNGGGPGTCTNASTEWTFSSPAGWAKASVFNLDYTVNYNAAIPPAIWTMSVGSFDVGAASYGAVTYSTPNKNTITNATFREGVHNYETSYAQAQGYFNATLTGSIGGSANFAFGSLSTSINFGASWTQYVNFRVWAQEVGGVAAYYK